MRLFTIQALTPHFNENYLKEEGVFQNLILVSQDPISTLTSSILTVPWQKFLSDLWKDKFV